MTKKPKSVFNRTRTVFGKNQYPLCRIIKNISGKLDYVAPKLESTNINEIIEEDKKYGVFNPANGEYYTYKVLNGDIELSKKETEKIIKYSHLRITRKSTIKFKPAKDGEIVDFRIEFRTVETDPDKQLTPNTLMYHYFPINSLTHPLRGLCVVNKDYYWTSSGKPIPLNDVDPDTQFPKSTVYTYDFDQVYTHELLHGFGLPHSKEPDHMLSTNYGIMSQYLSEQDTLRFLAKYPKREMTESNRLRWLKWLFVASDR